MHTVQYFMYNQSAKKWMTQLQGLKDFRHFFFELCMSASTFGVCISGIIRKSAFEKSFFFLGV